MSQRGHHDWAAEMDLRRAKANRNIGDIGRALFLLGMAWAHDESSRKSAPTDRTHEIASLIDRWRDEANGVTPCT